MKYQNEYYIMVLESKTMSKNRKRTEVIDMNYHVGVISGDGIGPEVVAEAQKVLDAIGAKFGHTFTYDAILMGGCSIDATGVPLTDEAIAQAKASDAVLMGSIGGNTATSP